MSISTRENNDYDNFKRGINRTRGIPYIFIQYGLRMLLQPIHAYATLILYPVDDKNKNNSSHRPFSERVKVQKNMQTKPIPKEVRSGRK